MNYSYGRHHEFEDENEYELELEDENKNENELNSLNFTPNKFNNFDIINTDHKDYTGCEYDNYNKFQILKNIFNRLIIKIKCDENCKEIEEYYDDMNFNYKIKNKILTVDTDFSLLFVDNKQIAKNTSESIINENIQLKLLSLFEEDVRNFIKNKNKLKILFTGEKIKLQNKPNTSTPNTPTIDKILSEIYNLLIENFELLIDIFENFKITEVDREATEIKNIEEDFIKINKILMMTIDNITDKLTGEQSFIILNHITENINEDNRKLEVDIKIMKKKLLEYDEQGEELSNLVREYKKLCNLIECNNLDK